MNIFVVAEIRKYRAYVSLKNRPVNYQMVVVIETFASKFH
jgi:hypothetical protein